MVIYTSIQFSMSQSKVSPLGVVSAPKSMLDSLGTGPLILYAYSILTEIYGIDTGKYFDCKLSTLLRSTAL